MNDDDRVLALRKSAMPGGDGTGIYFNAMSQSYLDISMNAGVAVSDISVKEFPDRISRVELGIIARFSTGLLSITMSEHVDATPGMDVNTSLLFLTDFTGAKSISLSSSSVTSVHSGVINITLTEA